MSLVLKDHLSNKFLLIKVTSLTKYAANDVFPEEFRWFLLGDTRIRTAFMKHHADLLSADWWNQCKQRVIQGRLENIYPYDLTKRLPHRRVDQSLTDLPH